MICILWSIIHITFSYVFLILWYGIDYYLNLVSYFFPHDMWPALLSFICISYLSNFLSWSVTQCSYYLFYLYRHWPFLICHCLWFLPLPYPLSLYRVFISPSLTVISLLFRILLCSIVFYTSFRQLLYTSSMLNYFPYFL